MVAMTPLRERLIRSVLEELRTANSAGDVREAAHQGGVLAYYMDSILREIAADKAEHDAQVDELIADGVFARPVAGG